MSTTRPEPLWRALLAWAAERYPPENAVVVLVVSALAVWFGRALTHDGPLHIRVATDAAAAVSAYCYFLLLRILDEHKDYELDLHNHPRRVLQSGRITLDDLKALGAVAVAVQLALTLLAGGAGTLALWGVLLVWTALMAKEFFVHWPPRWFPLYAFMHMLSMPFSFLWLASFGAGRALTPDVRWLALLGALIGASLEVARKFRTPAHERATIDTYTRALGVRGASVTLATLLVAAAAVTAALLAGAVSAPALVYAVALPLAAIPGLRAVSRFARHATGANAKRVETAAGLSVLALVLVAIAALLAVRGIA